VPVKHVVLGLLIEQPSCAYELGQRAEQRLRPGKLPVRNVYAALDTLERDGLVARVDDESEAPGSRSRQSYQATAEGVKHFADWIDAPTVWHPEMDDLHLKVLFSGPENFARLDQQAQAHERHCRSELQAVAQGSTDADRTQSAAPGGTWEREREALVRASETGYWELQLLWIGSVREALTTFQTLPS
jgi:DNA-binding PadR family transcriptional regulator